MRTISMARTTPAQNPRGFSSSRVLASVIRFDSDGARQFIDAPTDRTSLFVNLCPLSLRPAHFPTTTSHRNADSAFSSSQRETNSVPAHVSSYDLNLCLF